MAEIIKLAERKPKPVPPKSASYEHGGQHYVCSFDPNAPKDKQWVWCVDYVRKYKYMGSGPTMESVAAAARRKIHMLNLRIIAQEEHDASNK